MKALTDSDKIDTLPFSEAQQEAIVGWCLLDSVFFIKCQERIKPTWFTYNSLVATVFDQLVKFYQSHGRYIKSPDELMGEPFFLEQSLTDKEKFKTTIGHCMLSTRKFDIETLKKYLTGFIRLSLFKESIQGAASLYNAKGFSDAYHKTKQRLQEIEKATFEDDAMVVSFANPSAYLNEEAQMMEGAISTGSSVLDKALGGQEVDTIVDGQVRKTVRGGLMKGECTAILAPTNSGKCLGKDTPVLMYDGTIKKVQDIVTGDQLMGPDSKPRTVLGTTRGLGPLYEISPNAGGMNWICNDVHVLSLKRTIASATHPAGSIVNISVKDFLQQNKEFQRSYKLWRSSVIFPEQKQDIPAYILGLWLGDGHSAAPRITTMDQEVVDSLKEYARSINCKVTYTYGKNSGKANTYNISGQNGINFFLKALQEKQLINNKHIPKEYLTGSRQQRLELLAGLVDTDGHVQNGYIDFIQKSEILANQTAYVARSLGFKVSITICKKSIRSTGFIGTYYRLTISGNISDIPTRIKRKQNFTNAKKNPLTCGFTVKSLGIGEYYGFELDGDHLFLLGDFTVTHNTTLMITLMRHAIYQGKKVLFYAHEGRKEAIRKTLLAAMLGINKRQLQYLEEKGMRKELNEVSNYIDTHITYVHYVKSLSMFVEDVIEDIKRRNEEHKLKYGVGYDLVVDDYPAKLKSRALSRQQVPLRAELAYIYDAFNLLSGEIQVHCLVAAQTNREGYKNNNAPTEGDAYLDIDSIGESYGIGQNMANMISLNRSAADKKHELLHITVIKSRENITHLTVHTRTDYSCGLTHGDANMFERFGKELKPIGLVSYLDDTNQIKKSEDVDAYIKQLETDYKTLLEVKNGAFGAHV